MTLDEIKNARKELKTERKAIIAAYKEAIAKMKGLRAEKVNNQKKLNELGKQMKEAKKAA